MNAQPNYFMLNESRIKIKKLTHSNRYVEIVSRTICQYVYESTSQTNGWKKKML